MCSAWTTAFGLLGFGALGMHRVMAVTRRSRSASPRWSLPHRVWIRFAELCQLRMGCLAIQAAKHGCNTTVWCCVEQESPTACGFLTFIGPRQFSLYMATILRLPHCRQADSKAIGEGLEHVSRGRSLLIYLISPQNAAGSHRHSPTPCTPATWGLGRASLGGRGLTIGLPRDC